MTWLRTAYRVAAVVWLIVLAAGASTVRGDTFEWASPVSDMFFNQNAWTPVGGGIPPPGAGDTAIFDVGGNYIVTFTSGGTTRSDILQVNSGIVSFNRSSTTIGASYALTTGGADAQIHGGHLVLGTSGRSIFMTVGDLTSVRSGSEFLVSFGSQLTTSDLEIANSAFNGSGTMRVGGSTLNVTGSGSTGIGSFGTGLLEFHSSAMGTINQTVNLGTSTSVFATGGGTMTVTGGSIVNAATINAGGGDSSTDGTLAVVGSGSTLTQGGGSTLNVGGAAGTGTGEVRIDFSGILTTGGMTTVNATGQVYVGEDDGSGTFNSSGNILVDGGEMVVFGGASLSMPAGANLTVENGGLFEIVDPYTINGNRNFNVNSGGHVIVLTGGAVGDGSGGAINATGTGSQLDVFATLDVGQGGSTGTITLSDNAQADFASALRIGGSDSVAGAAGTVTVQTGADVDAGIVLVNATGSGSTAELTVDGWGSSLSVPNLQISSAAALGTSTVNIVNQSLVTDPVTFNVPHMIEQNGTLNIADDGTFNSADDIDIEAGGTIRVADGGTLDMNGHTLTNKIGGTIKGNGDINFDNPPGPFLNFGTVAPGDSAGVLTFANANYSHEPDAILEVELAGDGGVAGVDFDQLHVLQSANLEGALDVSVIDGFVPNFGDSFRVFVADGGVSNTFSAVNSVHLLLDAIYGANDVTIRVTGFVLPGDFDLDGDVDLDDYDILSGNMYGSGLDYGDGDATGDGLVDFEDFVVMALHFGETNPEVLEFSLSGGEVPEPGMAAMVVLGMISVIGRRIVR